MRRLFEIVDSDGIGVIPRAKMEEFLSSTGISCGSFPWKLVLACSVSLLHCSETSFLHAAACAHSVPNLSVVYLLVGAVVTGDELGHAFSLLDQEERSSSELDYLEFANVVHMVLKSDGVA